MFHNRLVVGGALLLLEAVSCVRAEGPRAALGPSSIVAVPVALPPPRLDSPAPNPPPIASVDYLADGFAFTTTKRALLARRGPLRFSEIGEPLSGASHEDVLVRLTETVVVAEHQTSVRLLVELRDVRLLLYAEHSALALVPRVATGLSVGPHLSADAAAGVRVVPGFVLTEKDRRGAMVRMEGEFGQVSFDGWLPANALGVVYDKEDFEAVAGEGLVREGTRVMAAASGPTVATFARDRGRKPRFLFSVEPESGAPPGWQRIRLRTRQLDIRGLVAAADYQPRPPGQGRLGGVHRAWIPRGIMSDSRRGMLAVGATLHAPADCDRIGRVLNPLLVYYGFDSPDSDGFVVVHFFAEELGVITALASAADIGPELPD